MRLIRLAHRSKNWYNTKNRENITMKKLFTVSLISCLGFFAMAGGAHAVSWWLQPTVCRANPTNCYAGMGAGFDSGMWDGVGNCWGLKMICPEALTTFHTSPVPMWKSAIAGYQGIKQDFDTSVLSGDCFGARKTTANGSMASVDGTFVKVWCAGILDNPSETLATGEIKTGTQPNCKDLAANGFVAVLNQTCYGKFYDFSDYYIECAGTAELPTRMIQLNGADKIVGISAGTYNYPTTVDAARALFDTMQSDAATQRSNHF